MNEPSPATPAPPSERALRNSLTATGMLGQLCALYDRGVFGAGRLMSNLLFQLAVTRKTNTPLLAQLGAVERIRVFVDVQLRAPQLTPECPMSPLVSLMWGLTADFRPMALWIPAMCRPVPGPGLPGSGPPAFDALTIAEWLDEPVIPTAKGPLSRGHLIAAVRDQDGGAHSDPDAKLAKSPAYAGLVESFPISRLSSINVAGRVTRVDELLPPVTMPLLRQIAHELLSALYSQSDLPSRVEFPSLVCRFEDGALTGAFVPEGYPSVGPVHGRAPTVVAHRAPDASAQRPTC